MISADRMAAVSDNAGHENNKPNVNRSELLFFMVAKIAE
jgi:hypothetical protein